MGLFSSMYQLWESLLWGNSASAIKILFGTSGLQRWPVETVEKVFKIVKDHGVGDLDAGRIYRSEGLVGKAHGSEQFNIHTKTSGFEKGCLKRETILSSMKESLEELKTDQVDTYFLHSPDPDTPFEETLEAIHELYRAGKFKRFGISNFNAKELQQLYDLCLSKGYVLPSVFQGNYSPIARHVEQELLPLVRKLNMSFYVYSPLAGGFLAKSTEQFQHDIKGRWDKHTDVGKLYNDLYNKPHLVAALTRWGELADQAKCTRVALAYRWLLHHSAIRAERGDGMIIGASKVDQLKDTLGCLRDGPLPAEVLPGIQEIWETVKHEAPLDNYHG